MVDSLSAPATAACVYVGVSDVTPGLRRQAVENISATASGVRPWGRTG
jgi:hypothetical protein